MANSPTVADGVKGLLIAANVGQSNPAVDWFVSIGQSIAKPSNLISIMETGGKQPNPAWSIDYPSVQVRVRGGANNYIAAREKIRNVKDALLGLPSQTISGDRWTAINAIGDIAYMGNDANDLPSFVMNFALIIEPAVVAGSYRE